CFRVSFPSAARSCRAASPRSRPRNSGRWPRRSSGRGSWPSCPTPSARSRRRLMAKASLTAIGGGVLAAALFILGPFAPVWVFIGLFAQLPLFCIGLSLGVPGAAIAAGVSTGIVMVTGGAVVALLFASVNALPALILSRQALLSRRNAEGSVEWYPPGLIIAT